VDAGLCCGRIEDELGLAIFLLNGVVAVDGELAEGLAIGRDAIAEYNGVRGIADQCHTEQERESNQDQLLQKMLDSVAQG